jgi:hypothetical protein
MVNDLTHQHVNPNPGNEPGVTDPQYEPPRLSPIGNLRDLLAGGGSNPTFDGTVIGKVGG